MNDYMKLLMELGFISPSDPQSYKQAYSLIEYSQLLPLLKGHQFQHHNLFIVMAGVMNLNASVKGGKRTMDGTSQSLDNTSLTSEDPRADTSEYMIGIDTSYLLSTQPLSKLLHSQLTSGTQLLQLTSAQVKKLHAFFLPLYNSRS